MSYICCEMWKNKRLNQKYLKTRDRLEDDYLTFTFERSTQILRCVFQVFHDFVAPDNQDKRSQ